MTGMVAKAGATADGRSVHSVTLSEGGLALRLLTLGATVQDLRLGGVDWPLVLGAAEPAAYAGPLVYAGAIVGPVANRIAGASARIEGRPCRFEANEEATLLHSGASGLHARIWEIEAAAPDRATLICHLPDGDGGFPGNRTIRAGFALSAPGALTLTLTATSDAATLMNLAHHGYWNLDGTADTRGHRLSVRADRYLPVNASLIPEGPPRPVEGTPFDLRAGHRVSEVPALDHNFCLAPARQPVTEAATLTGASGVRLRIETTEPGLQVYDGRHLAVPPGLGLGGRGYGPFAGIALEPQVWPDAPNRPDFPPALLPPGETYRQVIRFRLDRVQTP
ncbi:aldose epimerase family protein [Albidovulum sp.]|uniref:aldose epimerase family protein n=1 Tax=Albidovulum sp. TaxID=1872424 RepID=UPI0039B90B3D